ncbi:hypothetical protein [Methylorubrum extorquens]|uniref:hypothetical protein n=1 Tax=Methylorubrum extorquens TaxID=408 RepID=UPI00209CC9FD|nr:hypothetical protein [Methylorubrum extorquens]MCP1535499.1 hypothetical protein [Methylorubrum extorquens]
MPWFETTISVAKAGKIGLDLAKQSKIVRRWLRRISYRFKHGQAFLPVFGAGGAGKSTFPKFVLHESSGLPIIAPGYNQSLVVETAEMVGDIPGKIIVAPGQSRRVPYQWPELYKYINDGSAQGIINVVSYGYHAPDFEKITDHDLYVEGMSLEDFSAVYFAKRREVELEFLDKVLDAIKHISKPIWFVTLVTKQDIWWENRKEVKDYYENGDYFRRIDSYQKSLVRAHCQHEFISASLTLENVKTLAGDVLASTASGYDFEMYERSRIFTLRQFSDLLSRGRLQNV